VPWVSCWHLSNQNDVNSKSAKTKVNRGGPGTRAEVSGIRTHMLTLLPDGLLDGAGGQSSTVLCIPKGMLSLELSNSNKGQFTPQEHNILIFKGSKKRSAIRCPTMQLCLLGIPWFQQSCFLHLLPCCLISIGSCQEKPASRLHLVLNYYFAMCLWLSLWFALASNCFFSLDLKKENMG